MCYSQSFRVLFSDQRQVARTCFQRFFERDTPQNCWQLLPEAHKSFFSSASKPARPTRSKRKLNVPPPDPDDVVAKYFKDIVGDNQERIDRLVRIVRGLREAKEFSNDAYEELWLAKGGIFEQLGLPRQRTLYNGRKLILKRNCQYSLSDRLTLLFVGAEVDWSYPTDTSELSVGKGRATVAYARVAERAGVDGDVVRDDHKRSKFYLELLNLAGPGSLLELGENVAGL
jgi:hypothetical protein